MSKTGAPTPSYGSPMHNAAATELIAEFEVTSWDETTYDQPAEGPQLTRAVVRKTFRGALVGDSVTEVLTAQGPGGRGYVASERYTGTIDGRQGTIVFQHGALDDGGVPATFGNIVPGSGTGELAGLAGQVTYRHTESGATVTLAVTRPR